MSTENKKQDASAAKSAQPVLVDLGTKSKKLVKKLRKGKGKLMDSIATTLHELQVSGQIGVDVQPVIVVVSEKPDGMGLGMFRPFKM